MHWQSVLEPHGPQATYLYVLFWIFVAVCAAVWVLMMLVLLVGLRRRRAAPVPPIASEPRSEHRAGVFVGSAVAATVVVIGALTLLSAVVTHVVSADARDPVRIQIRGHMWWWEITYQDSAPDRSFLTANELHVPVNRPVQLELSADDVIHSFWVPNLAGKMDLIPGRENQLTFTADREGRYRGQCAQFCGLEHAHMALFVVAEDAASFERWRAAQIAPAAPAATPEQARGRDVFAAKQCAACHTVRGTPAGGSVGPDLTHVGGREWIAAGLLPTTRGSLAAWIADPQGVKPGNNMPMVPLSADELNSVAAYLAALR